MTDIHETHRAEQAELLDWANKVTSTLKCDDIMLALDVLGWKVVQKEPSNPPVKWPLSDYGECLRYCPDWAMTAKSNDDAA
jgi:hypothetical protein